jgi:hypothetical protein
MNGLVGGIHGALAAMLSGGMSMLAGAVVLIMTGVPFLTGNQLVYIVGILATAIIVYFAFVFGRAAKIKAQINKEKTELHMELGKSVR